MEKHNKIEHFKNNLLLLGKIIMPKIFYKKFSKVHFEIEKLLTTPNIFGQTNKLNIIVPRGLGKTTIATQLYPLYHIFVERANLKSVVVIISKTQQHSINCLQAIKDVIEYSPEFRALFGYHGNQVARAWRIDKIILDNGSVIITKGALQHIRGLNFGGVRPTLIVLDDIEDENNTKTIESMDSTLSWVLSAVYPALNTEVGKIVYIGTPLHEKSVIEQLAKTTDWKTVRYSYLYEENGIIKSIWEENLSVKQLEEELNNLKAIGKEHIFFAERMCKVTDEKTRLFKRENIHYYDGNLIFKNGNAYLELIECPEFLKLENKIIPINIFMGIDPASSLAQTADFSAIIVIGVDVKYNVFILDIYRRRVTPMQLADDIIEKYKMFNPIYTRIESIGYQEMLRDYLRNKIYIPGLEVKEMPRQNKSLRLEGMQPRFAQNKVFLKKYISNDLENELITFPKGSHDDLLDALYYAQKNIFSPTHENPNISKTRTEIRLEEEYENNFEWWMIV